MRVLAIDIGSSAVKGGYWEGGRFRARVRVEFETEFRGVCAEARVEGAGGILRAVERAGREVLRGVGGVDVVAFCAFSSGVVVTDEGGGVRVGAITHQDRRSVLEGRELVRGLGKRWLLEHTGNLPYAGGIGSSTLAWIRKHKRGALRGRYRVGQISSLVGWMLTGQWRMDFSQAVFLGLWDIREGEWSERVCGAVGVERGSLPVVGFADAVMGGLVGRMGRMWGVRAGTPVVGGCVDTDAAILQTPMRAGQLVHSTGSTDVLAMCLEEAHPAEGVLSRPVGVGEIFARRWLAVRTIAAAGSAVEWVRRVMFSELTEGAWGRILERMEGSAGRDSLCRCVPEFSGRRAAMEVSAWASFSGITLATGREEILGAVVRGLVEESVGNYRRLAEIHRVGRRVYCMGRGSGLRRAMHAGWAGGHEFRELRGDGLTGLVMLAERATDRHRQTRTD